MNYPEILNLKYLLRLYKTKKSYSNAQLATDLTSFGWDWSEAYIAALFDGKAQLDESKKRFVELYLLDRYSKENLA